MTQEQLLKQLRVCKNRWNGWGEDVFQEACVISIKRYGSLNNVNQALFQLLCKEAARKLLKHRNFEITFSQLQSYSGNNEEEDDFENLIVDPRSANAYDDTYQEKSFQLSLF